MSTSVTTIEPDNQSEEIEENFNLKPISPEGIFSFGCHPGVSCFNRCCHEIDVILTPFDILKIKTDLKLRSDEFLTKYTTFHTLKETAIPLVKLKMRENSNVLSIIIAHTYAETTRLVWLLSIQDKLSLKLRANQPKHAS